MSAKNKLIFLCLFSLASFLVSSTAYAGGFCCQPAAGAQAGAYGNISAEAGNIYLRADYTYSRMSEFFSGDSQVSLNAVTHDPRFTPMMGSGVVPETMDMHRITLSAAYSPTERLRLVLSVPWVINDMTMRMFMMGKWTRMKMDEVSGLGDVTLLGLYRVYQDREDAPTTAVSVGAGLKFPTGSSTVSERGKRVHAHMQPGTGSWDPVLTLAFTKMLTSDFLLQADANYHIATGNKLGYKFGDTVEVDAGVKYNLAKYLKLNLGLVYFHAGQADDPDNKYNGQARSRLTDFVGYTGEDSIWVSPGIQVLPFGDASIDLRFQYPIYYHTPDIEFVADYRLTAGVSYSF